MTTTGLQRWHGFLKSRDPAALWNLLHPDVVFESPVVHTPQRGRDITSKYLISATKVLGSHTIKAGFDIRQQTVAKPKYDELERRYR